MDEPRPGTSRDLMGRRDNNVVEAASNRESRKRTRCKPKTRISWRTPERGSCAPLPSLNYNDGVRYPVSPHPSDTDNKTSDMRKKRKVFCGYCGDITGQYDLERHIVDQHGPLDLWPPKSFTSRKMRRRLLTQIQRKSLDENQRNDSDEEIDPHMEIAAKRQKHMRFMKNKLKAKQKRNREQQRDTNGNSNNQEVEQAGPSTAQPDEHLAVELEQERQFIPFVPEESSFKRQLDQIRTMEALLNLTQSFKVIDGKNCLQCVPCITAGCSRAEFKYDFNNGVDFVNDDIPHAFSNLKKAMRRHMMENITHKSLTVPSDGTPPVPSRRNRKAGLIVGRKIYLMAIQGTPHYKLKANLKELSLNKLKVGEMHHSNRAIQEFLPCLYLCQRENMIALLNQLYPAAKTTKYFALTADKVTLHDTPYHVIGIYMFQEKGLTPLFLKAVEHKGRTAKGTAAEIIGVTLDMLKIDKNEMCSRFVGIATDGEYIIKGVDRHIREALGQQGDFFSFAWDLAHLIELAAKKSKGQTDHAESIQISWIRRCFVGASKLARYYKQPKNRQRLQAVAEAELDKINVDALEEYEKVLEIYEAFYDPLKIKNFSETRWAAYSRDVIIAIMRNFRCFYLDLDKQKDESSKEVRAIAFNAEFLLCMSGLLDIYEIITKMSLNSQRSGAFIWDVLSRNEELLQRLLNLSSGFKQTPSATSKLNFHKTARELIENFRDETEGIEDNVSVFRECDIRRLRAPKEPVWDHNCDTDDMHSIDLLVERLAEKLSFYVLKLYEELKVRFTENVPEVLKLTSFVFDVRLVVARDPLVAKRKLKKLFKMSTEFGLYGIWNIEFKTFLEQYVAFSTYVKQKTAGWEPCQLDSIYREMLFTEVELNFPHVLELLSASVVRTACEGVVEGYASKMKATLTKRERLSIGHLNEEMFLADNGPELDEADGLIEAAWDRAFKGKPWHFIRTSAPSKLKPWKVSKVLDSSGPRVAKLPPIPTRYDT